MTPADLKARIVEAATAKLSAPIPGGQPVTPSLAEWVRRECPDAPVAEGAEERREARARRAVHGEAALRLERGAEGAGGEGDRVTNHELIADGARSCPDGAGDDHPIIPYTTGADP